MAEYTNGEIRSMLAPLFGVEHADITNAIIVIETTEGYARVHGMASESPNKLHDRSLHINLLSAGIMLSLIHI